MDEQAAAALLPHVLHHTVPVSYRWLPAAQVGPALLHLHRYIPLSCATINEGRVRFHTMHDKQQQQQSSATAINKGQK